MTDRKIRFGLRTFLLVTTTIAIVAGVIGMRIYRDRLRHEAAKTIEDIGGRVAKDENQFITRVLFDSIKLNDEGLISITRHLRALPRLQELDIVRVEVTDEGIESIAQIKYLETLYLFKTGVTNDGIANLKRALPTLEIKTTEPDPIASSLIAATIYPHAIVGLDVHGERIAIGSGDGKIRVYGVGSNTKLSEWQAHDDWCFATRFSPDGNVLASGGGDDLIRLWDAQSFRQIGELSGHCDDVHSLVFTPDGKHIISAGDDFVIRCWDLMSKQQISVLSGHTAQIPRIAIDASGKFLASASRDHTVRLWDLVNGECVNVFSQPNCDVMSVAFDRRGAQLLAGDEKGLIRVWDVATYSQTDEFNSGLQGVFDMAVGDDGSTLIACGGCGTKLWNKKLGLEPFQTVDNFVSRVCSLNGNWVTSNADGQIVISEGVLLGEKQIINTSFGRRGF